MSAAADLLLLERRVLLERLRIVSLRLAGNPKVVVGIAIAGLLATFAGMLAAGSSGPIGTIMFVPWVALLATQLGPATGGLAGVAATALYFAAAEIVGFPDDVATLALRLAPLVGVGVAAGLSSRRISSDALELQETGAVRQALLDSTLDGICLTDPSGRVLLANAPLQRISVELGLPPYGSVTDRLRTLADRTTEPARFRERMHDLARDPAASEDEFELTESGRVFQGCTAPVQRADGTLVGRIWTLREVTADRHLERLRDTFVAAVSHELRTPLTSISGFLEMLADEEHELGPAGRRYVDVIRRGNTRMRRIVEDLLLVAEIEADRLELHPGPTDLADLTTAAVEAAQPAAAAAEIELTLDVEGPAPLEADARRLRQVLDHLISNAIKFTPAGGRVAVRLGVRDGLARVEVSDTGIGIPEDEREHLFERFFRTQNTLERQIQGTGLGLYISKAIVEAHGGRIGVQSAEGQGTTFLVELPV